MRRVDAAFFYSPPPSWKRAVCVVSGDNSAKGEAGRGMRWGEAAGGYGAGGCAIYPMVRQLAQLLRGVERCAALVAAVCCRPQARIDAAR